jgi:hypothetical protein
MSKADDAKFLRELADHIDLMMDALDFYAAGSVDGGERALRVLEIVRGAGKDLEDGGQ